MEYKGVNYQIVQTADGWRWTIFLDANSTKSGISRNRSVAILDALGAIQKARKKVGRPNVSATVGQPQHHQK